MFLSKLDDAMFDPGVIDNQTYKVGDFNLDITASNRSVMAQRYINSLSSSFFSNHY